MQSYLNDIGRYPLLTPQQELLLGRKIQAARKLQLELAVDQTPTLAQKRILRTGARARDQMVRSNLRLVTNIAKKYSRRVKHMTLLDLIQEGTIGLMRGVELFDPQRGYRFSTYSYWWIRQGITRAISVKDTAIKMPSSLAEKLPVIRRTTEELSKTLGREPTRVELAKEMKMSPEELGTMLVRTQTPASLDGKVNSDGCELGQLILDPNAEDAYDKIENDYTFLEAGLAQLSDREREVIVLRNGLRSQQGRSLGQVADLLGVSRTTVQQAEARALRKLRLFMRTATRSANPQVIANLLRQFHEEGHLVSC
jgi:RNA polymerase primary sigma factor